MDGSGFRDIGTALVVFIALAVLCGIGCGAGCMRLYDRYPIHVHVEVAP